jgi:predicted amidohydrolase YtcJ
MLADLAVLSDDYFSVDLSRLAQIQSMLTMVGGKVVYAAAPFEGMEAGRGR